MRSAVFAPLLALAATTVTAQYLNQTADFNLVVLSSNETINGTSLGACHEGAAIEGLCLGGASPFRLNYSSTFEVDPNIGVEGILAFELQGGNFNLSSPMSLSYYPTSNVAVPLFTPGYDSTTVSFLGDELYIPRLGYDDTQIPVNAPAESENFNRWYVCQTYAGYLYTTLAWVVGPGTPQNPSCQKVDVVRVFI